MYRIRFHGRGGQGMKTAANMLGDAFFASGFEVQDAPRYGAERRGAPMVAYVRAARQPIVERGAIVHAGLVVVADSSLLGIAAAGVSVGAREGTVLFVSTTEPADALRARLSFPSRVITWPAGMSIDAGAHAAIVSAACAGAAAGLVGPIAREALLAAITAQSASRNTAWTEAALMQGAAAYDAMSVHAGCVRTDEAGGIDADPDWVVLAAEDAAVSSPDIFNPATSERANTGLWRSHRPVIDYEHCNRCSWACSTLCPDSAITADADRTPHID